MSVASKSTIEQRALRIPVGPAMLDADLSLPASASGLVLFAHGSGSSRFSSRNRHVAQQLNDAGLATVLAQVRAPTLLIVGGDDGPVIGLNEQALARLPSEKKLVIVPGATHLFEEPGALDQVAALARDWFLRWLPKPP